MEICIVGTGYVGLVTAACFAETGNSVHCVDVNAEVINKLNAGSIHIFEPELESLVKRNLESGRLMFSTDLSDGIDKALFIFICVGTPADSQGACDLTYVRQVASRIGELMSEYKIVVNKSTVPIGTADEVRRIIEGELAKRGVAVEFDVVSNPEFLKEGSAVNDFMSPDRIIIGTDNIRTLKLLETLYSPFARARDKLITMDAISAEMAKYAANCMLATKISLMNELANICEKVGANIMSVRSGIGSDRRIGYSFIYPGIGYGGSCFPKDVRALINTAKSFGVTPGLISAVDAVNNYQKTVLPRKIINFFEGKGGVNGKTLTLWGLAFKPNTDDIRESAAISIIQTLTDKGMKVRAFDPVAMNNARNSLKECRNIEFIADQYRALEGADALALATDWNQFKNPDFSRIKKTLTSPVIFDGRNLYSPALMKSEGFDYFSIGRPDVRKG